MLNDRQKEFADELVQQLLKRNHLLIKLSGELVERAIEGMDLFSMSQKKAVRSLADLIVDKNGELKTGEGEDLAITQKVENGSKYSVSAAGYIKNVPDEVIDEIREALSSTMNEGDRLSHNYAIFMLMFAERAGELGYLVSGMSKDWAKSRVESARKRDQNIGETLLEAMYDVIKTEEKAIRHDGKVMVSLVKDDDE